MIYLDNAATTFPKPNEVYKFMDEFYREYGVNATRGRYASTGKARNLIADTRKMLLNLFNSPTKEVIFAPSATESLNIVLQGLEWKRNQTVYITPFEHNAVLRTLHYLKRIYDLHIIELYFDAKEMVYDMEKIRYQFQDNKPDCVIMNHASNVCGLITPIVEIFNLAKQYDSITVADLAQTAGLLEINLTLAQVDFAIFAGHKALYGPFGAAGFIMDKTADLKPLLYGGTGTDSVNTEMPDTLPYKFEVGSLNIMAISGLYASLKWIAEIGINTLLEVEQKNRDILIDILSSYKNIRIVGLGNHKNFVGVVSCIFDGYSSNSIGHVLSNNSIASRTGLHCAPGAHRILGTLPDGTVRFSVGYFNTNKDFMHLDEVLSYIAEQSF